MLECQSKNRNPPYTTVTLATQHNARGMVSMANSGPDTNASQFFMTYAKNISLDGQYPVFGRYG